MIVLNHLPHKKDACRTLRNNLTTAEAKRWSVIKNSQLAGQKFCHQHSVSERILDFYCSEENLAVELDGVGNFTASGNLHDATRTEFFSSVGIRVIKFENKLIWLALDSVLHSIESNFGLR